MKVGERDRGLEISLLNKAGNLATVFGKLAWLGRPLLCCERLKEGLVAVDEAHFSALLRMSYRILCGCFLSGRAESESSFDSPKSLFVNDTDRVR
jgi:hypothetical protein